MNKLVSKKIKTAPQIPGVYIFYKNSLPLYIGKASNLKNRLQSYLKITDIKNKILNEEANKLKLIKLRSPVEALIAEANLIKTLKPQYNVLWRDDKNYFYVGFTPPFLRQLADSEGQAKKKLLRISITHQPKNNDVIGPFTDGKALRLILKIIRRRYPYCTCLQTHLRSCLNAQIGNCLDYCCRENAKSDTQYLKNIKIIKQVLMGKKMNILNKIIKSSESWAFENIYEHIPFLNTNNAEKAFQKIECYDISHFSGKEAVGAFTVLVNKNGNWESDGNQFRKFRIKNTNTRNDPQMISEILSRRLNHPEWPYPNLIIIDGGITQYNAAKKIAGNLPLISFAKPNKKIFGKTNLPKEIIEKAIEQTHRYVLNFHRHLRNAKLYS